MRRTILFIILAGLFGSIGAAQDSVTITSDPNDLSRPISTLLGQLRQREKISVTYEDPRYSNSADIQDVTSQVAKNLSPTDEKFGPRILVPKGKAVTFVYAPRDVSSPDGAERTIARMLQEYAGLGGPTFDVVREGVRLHVLPSETVNAAGARVRQDSILDAVITIPAGRRTTNQLLQAICDELKKETGYQVDAGMGDPTYTNLTPQVVDHETARAAIDHLLDSLATPGDFVWDLYYDPSDKAYVLNFSYMGSAGRVEK